MLCTVTYGYINGSVIIFSDAQAEEEEELPFVDDYEKKITNLLNLKLQGDKELDDDNFLGTNFNNLDVKDRIEIIIKRVVQTVKNQTKIPYKLLINYIDED